MGRIAALLGQKTQNSERGSPISSDIGVCFQTRSAIDPRDYLVGCNISEIDVEIEMWLVDLFRFANQALLGIFMPGVPPASSQASFLKA